MKTTKRFLSLLLCGALLFSLCPQVVLAEAVTQDSGGVTIGASGFCEHHTEHDEDCGYTPATEGTPCGYVCEICNAEGSDTNPTDPAEKPETECICETLCTAEGANADCLVCGAEDADLTVCKGEPALETAECICTEPCTEDNINRDCPVCGAEGTDLSACKGEQTEQAQTTTITGFDTLPEEVREQHVPAGTKPEELNLPATLGASGYVEAQDSGEPKSLTIEKVEWESDPAYDENAGQGEYIFTAKLPEGYALAEGVSLPQITVMAEPLNLLVGEDNISTGNVVIDGNTCSDACPGHYIVGMGETANTITVTGGEHTITLSGVSVTSEQTAFDIQSGTVTLILGDETTNNFTSGDKLAGIHVAEGASLTIQGSGTLNATGDGAGIGGNDSSNAGSITIEGGTVVAKSIGDGAGIGGGHATNAGTYGKFASITITGGHVTAQSNGNGAGIGCGCHAKAMGTITISGGEVHAKSVAPAGQACDIGWAHREKNFESTVSITGSVIYTEGNNGIGAETVAMDKCVVFDKDGKGKVYGQELPFDFTIPSGKVLVISEGENLTVSDGVTLTNQGTIENAGNIAITTSTLNNTSGEIENTGTITINGTLNNTSGKITNIAGTITISGSGTLNNTSGTILNYNGTINGSVQGNDPQNMEISYWNWDENKKELTQENYTGYYTLVDSSTTTWNTGWYVVQGEVTVDVGINVIGDVHLILMNDCKLTAGSGGIRVRGGENSLTIYAQSPDENMGQLYAKGGNNQAGIGGQTGLGTGTITINGGNVTAIGSENGAGIGGSMSCSGGTITINGGVVTASGGYGAGIGGGGSKGGGYGSEGGTITINGGSVTANGGGDGAGIGGGGGGDGGYGGAGGTITINGGSVTANGNGDGAGIGGGGGGAGGTITINGGSVTANGNGDGAGIGGGGGGSGGTIAISGGCIIAQNSGNSGQAIGPGDGGQDGTTTKSGGLIIELNGDSKEGQLYSDVTLDRDFTIPGGTMVTIPERKTLTIAQNAALTNDGTITNNGTIVNNGHITINGTINNSGSIEGSGSLEKKVTLDANEGALEKNEIMVKGTYGDLPTPTRDGYAFNGWYTAASGGEKIDSSTTVTITSPQILYAQWTENKSRVAVTFSKDNPAYGETITITATIAAAPATNSLQAEQNQVAFSVDGKSLSTVNVTGTTATLQVTLTGENWEPGQKTITAEFGGSSAYTGSTGQGNLTVTKAILTPTANATDKTYDSTTDANGTISLSGAVNGDNPTASGNFAFVDANAGTSKTVNVTNITLTGGWDTKYQLSDTSTTATATIERKSITGATINLGGNLTYTGQEQEQTVQSVTIDGLDATYQVSNNKQTNAGTYTLTVTGTENFTDSQEKEFTIAAASLNGATVSVSGTYTYTGQAVQPSVSVKLDNKTLTAGTDYTLSYQNTNGGAGNLTNAGTVTVTATGKGNYTGTASTSFTIEKANPNPDTPTGLTATYGQTLANVELPTGWAWDTPTTSVGNVGNNSFSATYTPTDTSNYNTVTSNLTVAVSPVSYTITLTGKADSPTQITLNEAQVDPSGTGAAVSYGYSTAANTVPSTWQTGRAFSGLTADTTYYFFAKVAGGGNYAETISTGVAITTPEKEVSSISIQTQPTTLAYTSGETLDLNGLSVQVSYNDSTSETIPWDSGKLTATPANGTPLTASAHNGRTVTISYGGMTATTSNLTVGKGAQATLSITGKPTTVYNGDTFTLTTTGGSGTGTVTWEIVSGPATVDANGKVTVTGTGSIEVKATKAADADYNEATATLSLTATTKPSGGNTGGNTGGGNGGGNTSSGGGSSSSGGGSTVVDRPDETRPDIPTTGGTKPMTPDSDGNVTINNGPVQSGINAAENDAKKNGNLANGVAVTIPITPRPGQTSFVITMKAQTLDTLVREKVERLNIHIQGVIVESLDTNLLKWLDTTSAGGDVIFRVSQVDALSSTPAKTAIGNRPAYDLSLAYLSRGKEVPITDLKDHTLAVQLPYTPAETERPGNLYAVYVDAKGQVEWLTNSSYDPDLDAVLFETGHFSVYGVGYKNPAPAFTDITGHWAADNIIFVASRGLLSGTSDTTFSPNTGMTRGMFVTALGRLAGINPAQYQTVKFSDVPADAYYAPYVNWAAQTGIVEGVTATTFAPDTNINREQMAVIMKNYAVKLGYDLPKTLQAVTFADNAQISSWAKDAVGAMQQAGILAGKANNRFDPKGTATRAEVATVLRRFVEIVIDPQAANG